MTVRTKIKKYFPKEAVAELLVLLQTIRLKFDIKSTHFENRDPKDNFLLDLIDSFKADYLITRDKDLLILNPFLTANIVTANQFE